jgi:hypothetical protein
LPKGNDALLLLAVATDTTRREANDLEGALKPRLFARKSIQNVVCPFDEQNKM